MVPTNLTQEWMANFALKQITSTLERIRQRHILGILITTILTTTILATTAVTAAAALTHCAQTMTGYFQNVTLKLLTQTNIGKEILQ